MLDVEAIRYIQNHTQSEIGRGKSDRERKREGEIAMVREGARGRGSEEGQVPPLCQGDIDTLLPAPVVWRLYSRAIHLISKWLPAAAIARTAARVSEVHPQAAADECP